jgi:hypothetical protein
MQYSKEKVLKIAYGQLTPDELDRAVTAIDGFVLLFGKSWIDNYFRWSEFTQSVRDVTDDQAWLEEHFKVGSLPILDVVAYWEDWCLLRDKEGANKTLKRWKSGVRAEGVVSEIFVAANLVRAGTEVELEPALKTGKVSDCRFRFDSSDDWTYVEVSKRGEPTKPRAKIRAESIRQKAARAAAHVAPGLLGTVVILREPNDEEVEKILAWLGAIEDQSEQKLDELAVFFTGASGQGFPGDVDRVSQLMKGVMPSSSYCDFENRLGIAWLDIRDNMHNKIVKDEREQLPANCNGIIVIDVSGVDGFKWLPDLAQEVFQMTESAQISALVFFRVLHASEGRKVEGCVLTNPHTINSLSARDEKLLQELFPCNSYT